MLREAGVTLGIGEAMDWKGKGDSEKVQCLRRK